MTKSIFWCQVAYARIGLDLLVLLARMDVRKFPEILAKAGLEVRRAG